MKKKKKSKNKIIKNTKRLIILFLIIFLSVYSFIFVENTMKPSLNSAAEIKTRELIEHIVIDSVYRVTNAQTDEEKNGIIKTQNDSDGKIALVTLNTTLLNKIGTDIAKRVNEDVSMSEGNTLKMTLGSLLGSKLLSQVTPSLSFDIIPVSVSDVSYTTEFESVGINQTKYKVFLNVNTEARVLVPFMSEKIATENTVLIAEAVIIGDVPDTFANIPGDDIPDFVS